MDAATGSTGLLGRMFDWIKVRAARNDDRSLLNRGDLGLMASDLGLTEADLRQVLPRARDNSLLMDQMMEARGLDPEQVRRSCAGLVRELELTCSRCGSSERCNRELASGVAEEHCHEYCGNAEVFDELLVRG